MGVIVLQRIRGERKGLAALYGGIYGGIGGGRGGEVDGDPARYRPATAGGVPPWPCSAACACPERPWCVGSGADAGAAPNDLTRGDSALWAAGRDGSDPRDAGTGASDMPDAGMSTVEYAVGTVVAAAFAAVLYKIVTGDSVVSGLTNLINSALSTSF